jgi:hypothetical protein
MIPAYLGMYFYCLSAPWPKWWKVLPAACLVLVLPGLWAVPRTVALLAKQKAGWAECYKRIENVEQCDQEAGIKVFPEPARTGLRGKLDFLKQHRLNLFFTPSGR